MVVIGRLIIYQSWHFHGIVPTGMVTLLFSLGVSLVALDKKIVQPPDQSQAPTKHWLMNKIWDHINPPHLKHSVINPW